MQTKVKDNNKEKEVTRFYRSILKWSLEAVSVCVEQELASLNTVQGDIGNKEEGNENILIDNCDHDKSPKLMLFRTGRGNQRFEVKYLKRIT